MTDREKLIEILEDVAHENGGMPTFSDIADYLLANGIIVPTCKVGDVVYQVDTLFEEITITKLKVAELTIDNKGIKTLYGVTSRGSVYSFDRKYNLNNIRFTKEEAEAELKKRGNENACNN